VSAGCGGDFTGGVVAFWRVSGLPAIENAGRPAAACDVPAFAQDTGVNEVEQSAVREPADTVTSTVTR
jgi:hypothetical protein